MERLNSSILQLCKCPVSENNRFRINLFLMCALNFLGGIVFLVTGPSLHQFVTSNSNSSDPSITPGLDLSESWYTLIVSASSTGVIVAAMIYSIINRFVYYKLLIITVLIINTLGGMLYANANNGWTLLSGIYFGTIIAQMRTYVGESTDKVLVKQKLNFERKQTKSPPSTHLKNTVFFILFISGVTGVVTGPLLETIASNISSLDQFRWPGYYLVGHSLFLLVLVVVLFDEKWDDINRRDLYRIERKTTAIGPCCKIQKPAVNLIFIFSYLVIGWNVSIIETLENPILSDNFGFDIKYTSYVMFSTLFMFIISSVGIYLLQRCNIDNRILLIGSFVIGAIGTFIIGDWQSLNGDPCSQIPEDIICSNTSEYITESGLDCIDCNITSNPLCLMEHHTLSSCVNTTDNSDSTCLCELFSNTPGYHCFWNPNSRITGEYCERCRHVCLSRTHSINLVQLTIGIGLLAINFPTGRLLVTILASNLFGPTSQGSGALMGILIATGAIAQITGSFWGDAAYVAVGYRTWLAMLILNILQLSVVLLYCVFYRKFVPQPVQDRSEDDHELLQFEEEPDDKFDAETKL